MGLQNRTTKSSYMATENVSGAEQPSEAPRTRSRSRQTKQSTSHNLSLTTRGEHSDMDEYGYESLASRTKLAPPENPLKDVLSSAHPTTTDHQVQNKTRAASRARLRSTSYRNKDSQNSGSVDEPRSAWKNHKISPRNNASYIPDRSRSRSTSRSLFSKSQYASTSSTTLPSHTTSQDESFYPNRSKGDLSMLANDQGVSLPSTGFIYRIWLLCKGLCLSKAKRHIRTLNWLPTPIAIIGWINIAVLLLVYFETLFLLISWPLDTADHILMRSCQNSWIKPICSVVCTKGPWPVPYVFSNTCSDFIPSNSTPGLMWEMEVDQWVDYFEIDLVNHLERPFNCINAQRPFWSLGSIPRGFQSAYNQIQKLQLKNRHQIDHFMWEVTYRVKWHKTSLREYLNVLLERPKSDETPPLEIVWPATTDLRGFPRTRNMNQQQLSGWNLTWQKDCESLIGSVKNLTAKIDLHRRTLLGLGQVLVETRNSIARARQEVANKIPLAIRIGQDVGLLTPDPSKLPAYDAFLKSLDPWIACASIQETLLTSVWNNLTEFNQNFSDKAAAVYSADVRASSVRSWIAQKRQLP